MKTNICNELAFIEIDDETFRDDRDVLVSVYDKACILGEEWDLIFLPNGIVTKNNQADIDRVHRLIKKVTG